MAEQVYDPESGERKPPKGIRTYRQNYKDFKTDQKDREAAGKESADKLSGFWRDNKGENRTDLGGAERSASRRLGGMLWRRKRLLALGIGGGVIAVLFAFSGLLSTLKMDHIMSNIDEHAFARLQGGLDVRNTAYIRTYMELRLSDICPKDGSCASINVDRDNLIFRSPQVRRSLSPLYNWYRTMRSSNFEADVFDKNGIFITGGVVRDPKTGVLTHSVSIFKIKGEAVDTPPEVDSAVESAIKGGKAYDPTKLVSYLQDGTLDRFFDRSVLTTNSSKRAAIKSAIRDNTQSWKVFQRRQLRKDIYNRTGTPKWRFFDDTRTKLDNKKLQIRNKIIDAATPENTKTGAFIDCLFGISDCKFSPDTSSPADSSSSISGDKTTSPDKTTNGEIDFGPAKEGVQRVIGGVGETLNAAMWLSLIDSAAKIDKNIANGGLATEVGVARGIQAMALYQSFETIRDQMKTGNANGEEVNAFMETVPNITASEAWAKGVDGQGNPSKLDTNSGNAKAQKFCKSGHQATENEYAYLCNGTVLGGVTGAKTLSSEYQNSTFHQVLGPLFNWFHDLFGPLAGIINYIFAHTFGIFIQGLLATVKAIIPSAYQAGTDGLKWAMLKMASLLGANPIIDQSTTSGQVGNWLVQGAAFTAESSSRDNGASITTASSQKAASANSLAFENKQTASQSFISKYLSPNNQQSPVANSLFAISQLKFSSPSNMLASIDSMFHAIGSAISLPFTHKVLAANANFGYTLAQVAQLQTFDFPTKCLNESPLIMSVADPGSISNAELSRFTNLKTIFPDANTSNLTEDTLSNNTAWYQYLYSAAVPHANDQIKNSSGGTITKAERVYNCGLLDNSVRGGLGYLYGFTADNGYSQ